MVTTNIPETGERELFAATDIGQPVCPRALALSNRTAALNY